MKAAAAVFTGPESPLELREFELPSLSPGEALVEIDCCTLCGSDLHTIRGARSVESPIILGHEMVGRIVELNGDIYDVSGNQLSSGDRVSWSIAASCGDCFFCLNDIPQKCEQLFKYGHRKIDDRHPLSGATATHCHLAPRTSLVVVPDSIDDKVASPANCATATTVAAFRAAGAIPTTSPPQFTTADQSAKPATGNSFRTVVIYGAGMLGLTAAAMAKSLGAEHVIVHDINPARSELSTRFGATDIDLAAIPELTDGRGADLVVDMSGSVDAIEGAIPQLRTGGHLILVGSVFRSRPIRLDPEQIVRKLICIRGVHNYAPQDLATAVDFLESAQHQYRFESLVEREFCLEEIAAGIDQAINQSPIRVSIRP